MAVIFHVTGISGSGKTTLGKKLAQNKIFRVIDLDDINDKNAMSIIRHSVNDNLFTEKNIRKFFKLKGKMNKSDLKKIIKKNKNRILIFVGSTIEVPHVKYGYCIKADPNNVYLNLNLKTINSICKNHTAIAKLLKSKISIGKKSMVLLHKYKVRIPAPDEPQWISLRIQENNTDCKKQSYKVLSAQNIYKDIIYLTKKMMNPVYKNPNKPAIKY